MKAYPLESPVVTYSENDLSDFIEGATLLATGGGGPKQVAYNLLEQSGVTCVKLVRAPYVPDEMQIAMVAQVFAPSDIWANPDYESALNSYKAVMGQSTCKGVLPVEVGAVNGIVPAIVAGKTESYLIADSQIDRSMSEMDMGLFQMNVPFNTLLMATKQGEVFPSKKYPPSDVDAMDLENDILKMMKEHPQFDGVGGFAAYTMTGKELNEYSNGGFVFHDTYEYARRLGSHMGMPDFERLIFNEIQSHLGPYYQPYSLFEGYFVSRGQQAHAQDYGYADFITADPTSGMGARVYYSNENMLANRLVWILLRGVPTPVELGPMAIGPDAVCYLLMEGASTKYQKGYSFTNEDFGKTHGDPDFFKGHKIQMIGIPEPRLRKADIIKNYTREIKRILQAFGGEYSGEYIPIEKLNTLQPVIDAPRQNGQAAGETHLVISSPVKGGVVRYTMDGSEPDVHSPIADQPIELSGIYGKILKAKLYFDDQLSGVTVCADFKAVTP